MPQNDDTTTTDSEHDTRDVLRPPADRPTVPVFYNVPKDAVDRAIRRFNHLRENPDAPEYRTTLSEYIYEEIHEKHVIYVGGEPLAEYAGGRVESLVIEPDTDGDSDT